MSSVLDKVKQYKMLDFKFMDFVGSWQHFTIPTAAIDEKTFENGVGFDGSSIRGFCEIHKSDIIAFADINTFREDPFSKLPTLSVICDILEPVTLNSYERDPRGLAKRAQNFLLQTGIGDTAYFGAEAEFYAFNDVRFIQTDNYAMYTVDSDEGPWNSDRDEGPNLAYKHRRKGGYFPVPPLDSLNDFRNEIVTTLQDAGIFVEMQHHEVGSAGQCEVNTRFNSLLTAADELMYFKYIVKNVAIRNNKTATFMPKPIFNEAGSGMHANISVWKDGKNVFAGTEYAGLSKNALFFIGGLIKHARSLCAFTNPTTNSYKRLVPGFEAPCNIAYSLSNRSAAIRIPGAVSSDKARRIEYRPPDPSCNPYFAFSAMLMAGLDGIINQIDPGQPLDKNIYGLSKAELRDVPSTPGSLEEALQCLEKDFAYLCKGEVFTEKLINEWIAYKYDNEVKQINIRPTPQEFVMYYDI